MDSTLHWLARILQVSDSAYPTGGYAHSYGFEQIVQHGLVRDEVTMCRYLDQHLWPMLVHFELPVVRFAREYARAENEVALIELDACVDAMKTARELREASRSTGRRRLLALRENAETSMLGQYANLLDEGRVPGHHAVVFGLGLAQLPEQAVLSSWAYQNLCAVCLSAPKLLRIGQNAAQRVLTHSLTRLEERVAHSLTVERDQVGWFDPAMEIASMQHEIAYERLFIS